jgi:hypothetical protein
MPCPATDALLVEQKVKFEEWKVHVAVGSMQAKVAASIV